MATLSSSEVLSLKAGLNVLFTNLQTQVKSQVLAEALPVVGDSLSQDSAVAPLATAKGKVMAVLDGYSATGGKAEDITKDVNKALNAAGFTGSVTTINGTGEFDFSQISSPTAKVAGAVEADLTLPGLQLDVTGAVPKANAEVSYGFNFAVGVDAGGEFYVKPTSDVAMDMNVKATAVKGAAVNGELGFIPVKLDFGTSTLLNAQLGVEFADGGNGTLNVSELNGTFVSTEVLNGTATPTFKLQSNFGNSVPMPEINADVVVNWDLAGAVVDANGANNQEFGAAPVLDFRNIGIDAASFLGGTLTQFASKILTIGDPVFRVANALTTPVPATLNDILKAVGFGPTNGSAITLIDLITDQGTAQSVKDIANLKTTLQSLTDKAGAAGSKDLIDLGGFSVVTDGSGYDLRNDLADLATATLGTVGSNLKGNAVVQNALAAMHASVGDLLTFPILETPGAAFDFLLGKTVDLVRFTPEPISIGFSNTQFFPIFPGIFGTLSYGANLNINFAAGYDSSGIEDFAASNFSQPNRLLNGLYLVDGAGSELSFMANFAAGVAAGLPGIFTVGVEGGLQANLGLELKDDFGVDGAGDGKVSFEELNAIGFNPLRAFSANGSLSAYLSAYLDSFFYSKSKNLGSITLFDFNTETKAAEALPIPKLASKSGSIVTLHIGASANLRVPTADGNDGESILISYEKNAYVVGSAAVKNASNGNLPALEGEVKFTGVQTINGMGGGGHDVLRADQEIKISINFFGEEGNDILQGANGPNFLSGGNGNDRIEGFGGDDTLIGGPGLDYLAGGDGVDILIGDENSDTLFGGGGNDKLYAVGVASNVDVPNAANRLLGGAGNDTLFGSTGADTLDGGLGADIIHTNGGADAVFVDNPKDQVIASGVEAGVTIYARASFQLPANFLKLILVTSGAEEGGDEVYLPISGKGNDLNNDIWGNLAGNRLDGFAGDDTIHGDTGFLTTQDGGFTPFYLGAAYAGGNDVIDGGPGNDTVYGGGGDDDLFGGDGNDIIRGEDGNDLLSGGIGADTLEGGPGDDAYILENFVAGEDQINDDSGFNLGYVLTKQTINLADPSFGGITGLRFFGAGTAIGRDVPERLIGGGGVNILYGNGGNDELQGGTGDLLFGGPGADTYRVNGKAKIFETPEPGAIRGDDVITSVSFVLPAEVENLGTDGTGFVFAQGNSLPNSMRAAAEGGSTLYGQGGDDLLVAYFFPVTFVGGPGNDTLSGSNHDDVLYGYADGTLFSKKDSSAPDDDTIYGYDGDDLIFGGDGEDEIDGGEGDDEIHTSSSSVVEMRGGPGNDSYYFDRVGATFLTASVIEESGEGEDTVFSVNDVSFEAVYFNNVLLAPELANVENIVLLAPIKGKTLGAENGFGNSLNNVIVGNRLGNELRGNSGADRLLGEGGNDELIGGEGADFMEGGEGNDILNLIENTQAQDKAFGGRGDDLYLVDHAQDKLFEKQGEGIDTIRASVKVIMPVHFERLEMVGIAIEGVGNAGDNEIVGNEYNNNILGLQGDDVIFGKDGSDLLTGGAGRDRIFGGIGGDSLQGGDGDDYLEGNAAADTLLGGSGNDDLYGHAGPGPRNGEPESPDDSISDQLFGEGGDDRLFGGGGSDLLNGGAGNDYLVGGPGSDTYTVDSNGDQVIEKAFEGFDEVISTVTYILPAEVEHLTLAGTANIDGTGTKQNNTMRGNVGNNALYGGEGSDSLRGLAGNDRLFGGGNDDFLYGDEAAGPAGNDLLDGGAGKDRMFGGKGDDLYRVHDITDEVTELTGEGEDSVETVVNYTLPDHVESLVSVITKKNAPVLKDGYSIDGLILTGNVRPNKIVGSDFADDLDGGANEDILIGGKGGDVYRVDNFDDVISEFFAQGVDVVLSSSPEYTLPENVENITLLAGITPSSQNAPFIIASGNATTNVMTGNDDRNILFGDGGADFLYGGGGDDILVGGEGNDSLASGPGADALQGGPGDDTYTIGDVLAMAEEDFGAGYDIANVMVNGWQLGANSHVEEIRLQNLAGVLSATGNDLANVIIGNALNNTLVGRGGNDTLNGGDGDDILVGAVSGSFDAELDRFTGGKGADQFWLTNGSTFDYTDGDITTSGKDTFAYITDFQPGDGDRLMVRASGSYLVAKTTVTITEGRGTKSITGFGFFHDEDSDGQLDLGGNRTNADDLMAFLGGFTPGADFDVQSILTGINA